MEEIFELRPRPDVVADGFSDAETRVTAILSKLKALEQLPTPVHLQAMQTYSGVPDLTRATECGRKPSS